MNKQTECKAVEAAMPDFLFDSGAVQAAARAHMDGCASCQAELASLQGTMQMLDSLEAPEPSPFWMARMGAKLREEQKEPARGWAGFVERLRTRFWLSDRSLKPVAGAAALGLVLVAGGGTWLDLASQQPVVSAPTQASNMVRDLQSLNENAQVFQQLSALDAPDNSATGND